MSPHSALQSRPHEFSPEGDPGLVVANHEVEQDSGILKLDASGQEALHNVLDEVIINKKVHLADSSIINDDDKILQYDAEILQGLENLLALESPTVEITDEHSLKYIAASSEVVARLTDPKDPESPDSAEALLEEQPIHDYIVQDKKSENHSAERPRYEVDFATKWFRENRTPAAEHARQVRNAERVATSGRRVFKAEDQVAKLGLVDKVFAPVDFVTDKIEKKAERVAERFRDRKSAQKGQMTLEGFAEFTTALHAVQEHKGEGHRLAKPVAQDEVDPKQRSLHNHVDISSGSLFVENAEQHSHTYSSKDAKVIRASLQASAEKAKRIEEEGDIAPVMLIAAAHLLEKTLAEERAAEKSSSVARPKLAKTSRSHKSAKLQTELS